jgi:hypothetical protein
MKFRRIACDCCKQGAAPSLCQAPTYVVSEVTDNSNVIFVLFAKQGRSSCAEALVDNGDFGGLEAETYELAESEFGDEAYGRRAEAIIDDCWRPTWRYAYNDDFEATESPIRRNQRLLKEDSGFWPRLLSRKPEGASRERL